MHEPVLAYVGLGANLGDPRAQITQALRGLAELPQSRLLTVSSLYRSAPIQADGPDFFNAVAAVSTQLEPEPLLAALQALERQAGRERPYRNAPRTLDLDLLLHGDIVLSQPVLTLPHPRLHERAFVLMPLAEIAPDLELPGLGPLFGLLGAVSHQRIERLATALGGTR